MDGTNAALNDQHQQQMDPDQSRADVEHEYHQLKDRLTTTERYLGEQMVEKIQLQERLRMAEQRESVLNEELIKLKKNATSQGHTDSGTQTMALEDEKAESKDAETAMTNLNQMTINRLNGEDSSKADLKKENLKLKGQLGDLRRRNAQLTTDNAHLSTANKQQDISLKRAQRVIKNLRMAALALNQEEAMDSLSVICQHSSLPRIPLQQYTSIGLALDSQQQENDGNRKQLKREVKMEAEEQKKVVPRVKTSIGGKKNRVHDGNDTDNSSSSIANPLHEKRAKKAAAGGVVESPLDAVQVRARQLQRMTLPSTDVDEQQQERENSSEGDEEEEEDVAVDSGKKKHVCTQCGRSFGNNFALQRHLYTHSGEKPFTCSECGRGFAQKAHLKSHERLHTGEKPFVCDVCQKAFARFYTLQLHQVVHTGARPFACQKCGKAFGSKENRRSHEKRCLMPAGGH